MREAGDAASETAFDAYASARWSALVRVAALLGTPDHLAPEVARAALARTQAAWAGRDPIDPDRATRRALLEERRLADAFWVSGGPASSLDQPESRRALEARLGGLIVSDRATVLWGALVGPEETDGLELQPSADEIRRVAELLVVPPLDAAAIAETRAHHRRAARRRVSIFVAVGAVLIALLGTSALLGDPGEDPTRPVATDPEPAQAEVSRTLVEVAAADNPAPVPWYSEGALHLDQSIMRIPTVRRVAQLGNGGVVLTYSGALVQIDDAGVRTDLADLSRLAEAASFVVSDADGLVAWVEVEPNPDPVDERPFTLVVRDTTRRIDLLRMFVDPASVPVAVDARAVYFNQPDKSVRIALGREEYAEAPRADDIELDPRRLVAAAGPTRVYRIGERRLEVEHALLNRSFEIAGTGAELADDGGYLATRTYSDETAYGRVHIYELPSGTEIDNGLDSSQYVPIDVELGPRDTITYLLAEVGPGGGPATDEGGAERLDLFTCNLSERYLRFAVAAGDTSPDRCSVQARIATSGVATFLGG
ncbi:hypothetical protein GCM10027020_22160 [Nocardioides salsibiostraticola]